MARRKPLNRKIIASNPAEADEELQRLESKAADGTLAKTGLQIGLLHAYPTWFSWNISRTLTTDYSRLTQSQFEQ